MYGLALYVEGQGHEHLGPGTSLVQRINWTQNQESNWVRNFRGPRAGLGVMPSDMLSDQGVMALRRSCRESSGVSGMGCDCNKRPGLGLFDGGLDPSTWGAPELAIVGLGAYMVFSTVFTTRRAAGAVKRGVSGAVRGARGGIKSGGRKSKY